MNFEKSKNIYEIYRDFNSSVSLLVGAGISVPEPTCLPLTREIAKSLMRLDWFEGDERFPIEDHRLIDKIVDKVRMEHLLSIFHGWRKHDPGQLITQFGEAVPNFYHQKIAELVKEKIVQRIFTTNFDLCIEKALNENKIPFQLIVDREEYLNLDNDIIQVVKLHGSVIYANENYTTKGLITTLESISQEMPDWKASHLRKSIDQYGLVCLGYSGNDAFDINPVLRSNGKKRIVWVFRKQPDPIIYREAIQTLEMSPKAQAVVSDITTFLGEKQELQMSKKEFHFRPSYKLSERFHPSNVLGKILEASGEYEKAIDYYKEVLARSNGSNYWMVEILDLFRARAVCYWEIGNYDQALVTLTIGYTLLLDYKRRVEEKSGGILPTEKRIIMEEELLYGEELMITYRAMNATENVQSLEDNLFKTLNQFEELFGPQPEHRSRLLLNSSSYNYRVLDKMDSNAYKNHKDALELSLKLKTEIGDLIGIVLALGQLSIIHLYLGDISAAQDTLLKCIVTLIKANTFIKESIPTQIKSLLCLAFFQHFTAGYCPANTRVEWDSIDKNLRKSFETSLNDLLFNKPVENMDRKGFILSVERDNTLHHILHRIRESVSRRDGVFKHEVEKCVKEFGINVVTPDDNILQYRAGLDLIEPDDTSVYYATKYGQWEAIGEQYEKAGDYFQAAASYQNALDGAEHVMTDEMFTQDHKDHGIEYLKQAIVRVSSKIGT